MKKLLFLLLALLIVAPVAAQDDRIPNAGNWQDRVFYELFVRSFYDSNGDGIGDFQGIIQKLDYLNDGDPTTTTDLGVTGLWLMPIMPSPSYHGYDVTDYRAVNPDYGTMDDFKALLAAAHARGIKVLIDLPVNHTSSQHPWFVASAAGDPAYRDWYVWDDSCPTYPGPSGQKVWIPLNGSCYYAVFWDGMPDLNYRNPAVVAEMDDIARFWLQDVGVDGFRLDALKQIVEDGKVQENTPETLAWARDFQDYVDSVNPNAIVIGEVWSSSFNTSNYVPAVDLVFEFDLAAALVQSARSGNPNAVDSLQNRATQLYPPGEYATFLTNHDQNRVMSTIRDVNKAKVAADLLLTLPGVPFVYYGEEIGMQGIKPDERIRTPMQWDSTPKTAGFTTGTPWEPLQNDAETVNVAAQADDPDSLLNHYRQLIHLRSDQPALAYGDFVKVNSASRRVYSFLRRTGDETVLVIVNLDNKPTSDYALSVENAGLTTVTATALYGADQVVSPQIIDGGFADYLPVSELTAQSLTVIRFAQ